VAGDPLLRYFGELADDYLLSMPTLSDLLDQASDTFSSLASHAMYAAFAGIQTLSVFTGLRPEVIAAGIGGFLIFVVVLKLGIAVK
jgi:hypothetical protein